MNQHTPGPWYPVFSTMHESVTISTWDEKRDFPKAIIALIHPTTYDPIKVGMSDEDNANARLIAAAPDLLEACRALLAVTSIDAHGINPVIPDDSPRNRAYRLAFNAIEKATQGGVK